MEFNEKLQKLRTSEHLTQEELAEKLYVSRTAISKWESGRGYPSIESLKAIAAESNGRYVPLATAGTAETTLGAIYRRFLRQVAAKEQNEAAERAAERYQVFLVPGLVLLLAGAALSKGRFRHRPGLAHTKS